MDHIPSKTNKKGFTLVEALVTGIIAVIIALIVYTVFIMHNNELTEGAVHAKLQMLYETTAGAIAQYAHGAHAVIQPGESVHTISSAPPVSPVMSIRMVDTLGNYIAGFKLENISEGHYILKDSTDNNGWKPFTVGGSAVECIDTLGKTNKFSLPAGRKGVTFNFILYWNQYNKDYILSGREDTYRCRN